jgi:FKBP-type peptidyl-prolyl cis-trans isomerase FklB
LPKLLLTAPAFAGRYFLSMKTTLSLACAALAVVSTLSAQTAADAPAAATAPAAPMDKVSYFIGKNVGSQIAQQPDKVNIDSFVSGIEDVITGKKDQSYAMGAGLGQQLKNDNIALDIAKLKAGILFATSKDTAKAEYTDEELTAAMEAFEKSLQSQREARMSPEERQQMAQQRAAQEAQMKQSTERASVAKEEGKNFLAENAKRPGVVTLPSGLQYEVIKEGKGAKPSVTDRVNVHYHGTLINGKVFDSSVDRGEPITFGVQEVIKGWTEGLQLMNEGAKYKLYIPANLAYGDRGAGADIGPGETLVFEVELLKVVK